MPLADFSLDGKVAIVTGASQGLGKEMAIMLARAGADVVVAARRKEELERTAEQIRALGRRSLVVPTDVTDPTQVNDLVERTVAEFGTVHILVNNAGGMKSVQDDMTPVFADPTQMTNDYWEFEIALNLHSTFYATRAVGPYMLKQKWGRVINISSAAGYRGRKDTLAYSAAKGGMNILGRSFAAAWAQDGITVNTVVIGLFPWRYFALPEEEREKYSYRGNRPGVRLPVGRPGHPSEAATFVAFLASDAASYTTGEIIPIDGAGLDAAIAPAGYVFPIVDSVEQRS